MSKMLTEDQAAECLGMSREYLKKRRQRGGGPPHYRFGKAVRYSEEALIAYREAHLRMGC